LLETKCIVVYKTNLSRHCCGMFPYSGSDIALTHVFVGLCRTVLRQVTLSLTGFTE